MTAAQRRTLGNIIALGGAPATGNGRRRRGDIRENNVLALFRAGLVEPDPTGPKLLILRTTVWTATAAGCIAFGAEIARVS